MVLQAPTHARSSMYALDFRLHIKQDDNMDWIEHTDVGVADLLWHLFRRKHQISFLYTPATIPACQNISAHPQAADGTHDSSGTSPRYI